MRQIGLGNIISELHVRARRRGVPGAQRKVGGDRASQPTAEPVFGSGKFVLPLLRRGGTVSLIPATPTGNPLPGPGRVS